MHWMIAVMQIMFVEWKEETLSISQVVYDEANLRHVQILQAAEAAAAAAQGTSTAVLEKAAEAKQVAQCQGEAAEFAESVTYTDPCASASVPVYVTMIYCISLVV